MGAVKVTDETNRVAGQLCFSPCIQTGQPRVLSLMDCSHPALPVDVVAKKIENSVQSVIGLDFNTSTNEDDDRDTWSARAGIVP